jgi:hypothetical protein
MKSFVLRLLFQPVRADGPGRDSLWPAQSPREKIEVRLSPDFIMSA